MITPQEIESLVLASLPGSKVCVEDSMGTGDHFEVTVESAAFAGKTLMEQHKIIYAILNREMNDRIHALQLKTKILK